MRRRDGRRAVARAAIAAAVVLLLLVGSEGGGQGAALALPCFSAAALVAALTCVEGFAVRQALRGASVDVFLRTSLAALALFPLLALEVAYADAVARGGSLEAGFAAAGQVLRAWAASEHLGLAAMVAGVFAGAFGLASLLRARGVSESTQTATGYLLLLVLLLCVAAPAFVVLTFLGLAVWAVYAAGDRLESAWPRLGAIGAGRSLRRRLRAGEVTLRQVELLAWLDDPAARNALNRPGPDDALRPQDLRRIEGLASRRAVARAAVAAANLALATDEERDLDAVRGRLALAQARLDAGTLLEPVPTEPWAAVDSSAAAAAERAARSVLEGSVREGVEAILCVVDATGDPDAVRAAIREAVLPHLAEV